jgi:hypothetical protein
MILLILFNFCTAGKNLKTENSTQSSPVNNSSNRTQRKRLFNILLNTNSTTEEDTEEETSSAISINNKKTKRRRRNFSSSTSSSYTSSSLTTNSNNTSNVTAKRLSGVPLIGEGRQLSLETDLIAYRTRSRIQSIEHSELEFSPKNLTSVEVKQKQLGRASTSKQTKLLSDTEAGGGGSSDCNQKESDKGVEKISDKNSLLSKKTINIESVKNNSKANKSKKEISNQSLTERVKSVNSENQQVTRQLRSHLKKPTQTSPETSQAKHNLRRKATLAHNTVVPKKRQRISDNINRKNIDNTGASGKVTANTKALNLGARLARGREPQFVNQDLIQPSTSSNQQSGHPPVLSQQNLLRRSSRGKSSTTGSCVSSYLLFFQ